MWQPQIDALTRRFRVLRYDLLGHGRTPSATVSISLVDFVRQLDGLLTHLSLDRVYLIGFSLGGVISQRFAADYPHRVERLVLLNTVYQRTQQELAGIRERLRLTEAEGAAASVDAAIERWFSVAYQQSRPDAIEQVRRRLLGNDPAGYLAAYRMFVNADEEIGDALCVIRCPTLVVTGELDVGSKPEMAYRMQRDLADAKVMILPGLRHMAPMEGAAQVNEALQTFLSPD